LLPRQAKNSDFVGSAGRTRAVAFLDARGGQHQLTLLMLRFWADSGISHDKFTPLTFKMAPKHDVVEWKGSFKTRNLYQL